MANDLPQLVPKIEGSESNDRPSGSGAPVSINTLKTTVAADFEELNLVGLNVMIIMPQNCHMAHGEIFCQL